MLTADAMLSFLQQSVQLIQDMMSQPGDDWRPTAIVDGDTVEVIQLEIGDDPRPTVDALAKFCRESRATCVGLVLSAWLHDITHREALILMTYTRKNRHVVVAPIVRHPDGPPTLGSWETMATVVTSIWTPIQHALR